MDKNSLSEKWKHVPGWEGIYSVSDRGLLRRDVTVRGAAAGHVTPGTLRTDGYYMMCLSDHPRRESRLAHRVVCEAFHGPPPFEGAYVLHWDDDRGNNCAENLRWGSQEENVQDAKRNGRSFGDPRKRGMTHCKRGHEFTGENTYVDKLNRRVCRKCRSLWYHQAPSIESSPEDPRHGTSNGYLNLKCRCRSCRDAYTEFNKRRYRSRRITN